MFKKIIKYDSQREYFFEEGCFVNELSNISEDEAVSIALIRVPVGVRTKNHRLLNTTERYVILDGRGLMFLGDSPPEEVSYGDVIHIPPGCNQSIKNIGDRDLVFLAICTPRFVKECYQDVSS